METMVPQEGITPDRWIFVTINDGKQIKSAILSGWPGSYLYGGSWRLSSMLEDVINVEEESAFFAKTTSGSTYVLPYSRIGTTSDSAAVLANWMSQIEKESDMEIHSFASYEECELFCSRFQYEPKV